MVSWLRFRRNITLKQMMLKKRVVDGFVFLLHNFKGIMIFFIESGVISCEFSVVGEKRGRECEKI